MPSPKTKRRLTALAVIMLFVGLAGFGPQESGVQLAPVLANIVAVCYLLSTPLLILVAVWHWQQKGRTDGHIPKEMSIVSLRVTPTLVAVASAALFLIVYALDTFVPRESLLAQIVRLVCTVLAVLLLAVWLGWQVLLARSRRG